MGPKEGHGENRGRGLPPHRGGAAAFCDYVRSVALPRCHGCPNSNSLRRHRVRFALCSDREPFPTMMGLGMLDESRKVGVGLTAFGAMFLFLGVMFFFDSALLVLGNVRSSVVCAIVFCLWTWRYH